MSEWVVVGKAQKRRNCQPRRKQSDDDFKYVAKLSKDMENLLRSSDTFWTPEQIQEVLQYPSMFDIWYTLDNNLKHVVKRTGKCKYSIPTQ